MDLASIFVPFSEGFLGHLFPFTQPRCIPTSHNQREPHMDSTSEAACPKSRVPNLTSGVIQHVLPSQSDNISSSTLFPAVKWAPVPLVLYPVP